MSKVKIEEMNLQNIANAIRTRENSTDTYTPGQMAEAISEISGGGKVRDAILKQYKSKSGTVSANTFVEFISGKGISFEGELEINKPDEIVAAQSGDNEVIVIYSIGNKIYAFLCEVYEEEVVPLQDIKLIKSTDSEYDKIIDLGIETYPGSNLYLTYIVQKYESEEINKTIELSSRNLVNPNGSTTTQNGITFTNNGDGSFTANGTATANTNFAITTTTIKLKNNTYYTQSVTTISGTQGGSITPAFKNSGGTITYNYFINNQTKLTTDEMISHTYNYYIASGTSVNNWTFKVQLEQNNSATSYTPYYNYPLNKVGSSRDYIQGKPDNWVLHKNIGKVVLDGSESWGTIGNNRYWIAFPDKRGLTSAVPCLLKSNYFTSTTNAGDGVNIGQMTEGYYTIPNYNVFFNYNGSNNDLAGFKTWLSTHNTEVLYVLATETTETITDENLVSQLNDLYYTKQANPDSTIFVNGDNNAHIKVETLGKNDFYLLLEGDTYQKKITGKNMLPVNQVPTQTINGLTITNLGDGTIKLNGKTTEETIIDVPYTQTLSGKTSYKYDNFNTAAQNAKITLFDESDNPIFDYKLIVGFGSKTLQNDIEIVKMRISIGASVGFSNYILKAILIKDGEDGRFEPYTGGEISPSPEIKSELESSMGVQNAVITCKNLFNINGELYDGTIEKYNNGFILTKGTNNYLNMLFPRPILPGTYKITYKIANSTLSSGKISVQLYGADKYSEYSLSVPCSVSSSSGETVFTIDESIDRLYISTWYSESTGASITLDNFMISIEGGEYQPYSLVTNSNTLVTDSLHVVNHSDITCSQSIFSKNNIAWYKTCLSEPDGDGGGSMYMLLYDSEHRGSSSLYDVNIKEGEQNISRSFGSVSQDYFDLDILNIKYKYIKLLSLYYDELSESKILMLMWYDGNCIYTYTGDYESGFQSQLTEFTTIPSTIQGVYANFIDYNYMTTNIPIRIIQLWLFSKPAAYTLMCTLGEDNVVRGFSDEFYSVFDLSNIETYVPLSANLEDFRAFYEDGYIVTKEEATEGGETITGDYKIYSSYCLLLGNHTKKCISGTKVSCDSEIQANNTFWEIVAEDVSKNDEDDFNAIVNADMIFLPSNINKPSVIYFKNDKFHYSLIGDSYLIMESQSSLNGLTKGDCTEIESGGVWVPKGEKDIYATAAYFNFDSYSANNIPEQYNLFTMKKPDFIDTQQDSYSNASNNMKSLINYVQDRFKRNGIKGVYGESFVTINLSTLKERTNFEGHFYLRSNESGEFEELSDYDMNNFYFETNLSSIYISQNRDDIRNSTLFNSDYAPLNIQGMYPSNSMYKGLSELDIERRYFMICNPVDGNGNFYIINISSLDFDSESGSFDISDLPVTQGVFSMLYKLQEKIISFSLDGDTYYAEDGMTWGDWVSSKYNTDGYVKYNYNEINYITDSAHNSYVANPSSDVEPTSPGEDYVESDYLIFENEQYRLLSFEPNPVIPE